MEPVTGAHSCVTDSLQTIEEKIISKFPAVVIDTDGVAYPVTFEKDRPSLKEMQEIVGGLIQLVELSEYCGENRTMVINEEGKISDLPLNRRGTRIAHGNVAIFEGDCIVGDILIVDRTLLEEEEEEEDPQGDTTTTP